MLSLWKIQLKTSKWNSNVVFVKEILNFETLLYKVFAKLIFTKLAMYT